jgi:hypothetical protein
VKYLVGEREFSLKSACQMAASLGPSKLSVNKSSAWVAVTRGPEYRMMKNLHCVKSVARKWLVETVID